MSQQQMDSYLGVNRLPVDMLWWLGMLALCIVPFMSSWRTGTLSSFYLEAGALFFAVCLFCLTVLTQRMRVLLPAASVGLLLFAVLLILQARIMGLPYASQSDLAALVFVILAALAWSARAWVIRIGQTQAVTILAMALVLGVLLQTVVCAMQFAGVAGSIPGVLTGPGNHYVYGQLAQRNHLGHYLMWGVLALCFLWQQRRIPVWLVIPLLVWFTGVMGLVGSRTIIAYILVIGLSLFFWRWRAGAASNRFLCMLAAAITLVLLFQLILSPLCELLWHINFQSGTGRLEQGSFAQSGRRVEWHKAWLIFKSAPWFGYGWGSYSYQGFAIGDVYPAGFRSYENTVLFTHCHNLVLQLLAENGVVGLVVVVGCFFYVIWPHFRKGFNPASILLVSLILVSLCHSMLEYPLWYSYFLAVFVLFMALTPVSFAQQAMHAQSVFCKRNLLWAGMALTVMLLMLWQMVLYQQFLSLRADRDLPRSEQMVRMKYMRNHMYFMRYYVDMAIVEKLNAKNVGLPDWGKQAALLAGLYRPYSNTFMRGLYLSQDGEISVAQEWFDNMSHYYPTSMPSFLNRIKQQPQAVVLLPHVQELCNQYVQYSKQSFNCI